MTAHTARGFPRRLHFIHIHIMYSLYEYIAKCVCGEVKSDPRDVCVVF